MATVTHYIRSSYSPSQRDRLLRETGQPIPSTSRSPSPPRRTIETVKDLDDAWRTESTFGAQRRVAQAPKFVRARLQYDEFGNIVSGMEGLFDDEEEKGRGKGKGKVVSLGEEQEKGVAGWYRALVVAREKRAAELDRLEKGEDIDGQAVSNAGLGSRQQQEQHRMEVASVSSVSAQLPTTSTALAPYPQTQSVSQPHIQSSPSAHRHTNWFTTRPLPSTTSVPSPSQSTLADILARNPPTDKTSSKEFKPPVFLHLSPENVGWRLLEKGGWREGEGLGMNVRRTKKVVEKTESRRDVEVVDVDAFVEREARQNKVDVIDLTADDEAVDVKAEGGFEAFATVDGYMTDATLSGSDIASSQSEEEEEEDDEEFELDPTRTTLLTPLPTVLKADKLGIGLHHRRVRRKKAKKVTHKHTSEAMKEHIRRGEDMRRKQREVGRGRRGFERMRKREEEERRRLIGYLNA